MTNNFYFALFINRITTHISSTKTHAHIYPKFNSITVIINMKTDSNRVTCITQKRVDISCDNHFPESKTECISIFITTITAK